jgi:hypothetical protein
VGKVVSFKKPEIIRCTVCNKLKPDIQEKFSHRGIDNTVSSRPISWVVYQSGWKRLEIIPLKTPQTPENKNNVIYYHCPDCRSL